MIGPLLSKGIEKITQRAEELALPLFSLSQQHGIEGSFVFYFALSPNAQAQAIAEYAIQKKELKKFAILFPKDKFGEQFSEAFWDSVERLGGEITGIEAYPPQETDFRQYIDKLSGLYYQEARTKELEELARTREELQIKKKTRKTEKYYQLKPLIDYDAVFIPDEPKNIGQILPTFAYRDVEGVKFLGISTWNSKDLVTRAMPYAEGSIFVDIFYQQNQNFTFQSFMDVFKGTYSAEPSSLEAIAYDTASLLEKFINKYNITTRIGIAEKTKNISNYQGATGLLTFQDAQIKRKPMILTIQKGQIIEVQTEN
ncbi:MAG: penicillin-binding protein activator [Deltaproteobacteria bacterium]|nr:penicillin-binding protein activator [Deltaproteobacteria bacterium]